MLYSATTLGNLMRDVFPAEERLPRCDEALANLHEPAAQQSTDRRTRRGWSEPVVVMRLSRPLAATRMVAITPAAMPPDADPQATACSPPSDCAILGTAATSGRTSGSRPRRGKKAGTRLA